MGDFNEILFSYMKKKVVSHVAKICMDRFTEASKDCGLSDMGFSGDLFTWRNNNHNNDQYIRERLHRVVAVVEIGEFVFQIFTL
jgi:hypothetical protein